MAFVRVDSPKSDVVWPELYALLGKLEVRGVAPEAVDLAKPHGTWSGEGVRVRVWEVEKARARQPDRGHDPVMNGEPGALLVGLAEVDESNTVLGVAFLKRSAPTDFVEPIRRAMQSLSPVLESASSATTSDELRAEQ